MSNERAPMSEQKTTHFGFEQVAVEKKAERVAGVFHSVAAKYDVMNDVMSLGIHRLWKRFAIELSGARAGQHILDIAGGTGDLLAAPVDQTRVRTRRPVPRATRGVRALCRRAVSRGCVLPDQRLVAVIEPR